MAQGRDVDHAVAPASGSAAPMATGRGRGGIDPSDRREAPVAEARRPADGPADVPSGQWAIYGRCGLVPVGRAETPGR